MEAPLTRQIRRTQQDAGARLIEHLMGDADLMEMVAERMIAQKVASGELMRSADLMGGTFEMIPLGERAALHRAIDDALEHLDSGRSAEAIAALEATIPAPEHHEDAPLVEPADDEAADDEPADEEPAGEEAEPGPATDDAPARRRRPASPASDDTPPAREAERPKGMPTIGNSYDCAGVYEDGQVCGAVIDGAQAQASWTRFRKELCPECMGGWDQKTQLVKAAATAVA